MLGRLLTIAAAAFATAVFVPIRNRHNLEDSDFLLVLAGFALLAGRRLVFVGAVGLCGIRGETCYS